MDSVTTFYRSITNDEQLKDDRLLQFEPFGGMEEDLINAPYAITMLGKLSLMSTKR